MDDEFDSLVCQYIIVVRHVEDEIMLARDFQQYLDEFGDREGHRRSVLYLLVDREPEFAVQDFDQFVGDQMSNFSGRLITGSSGLSVSESIVTKNDLMPLSASMSMSITMSFCTSYCWSMS